MLKLSEEVDTVADAIVVLGGAINCYGTLTPLARARVEHGVHLLREEVAPRLLFSGQMPILQMGTQLRTEAAVMAEYAEELGVPTSLLETEERSRDTLENAYFTRTLILDPHGWHSIVLVTSRFHIARAALIFSHVLGPDYHVESSGAPDGLSPEEQRVHAKKEIKLTEFAHEFLRGIEPGNLDQLRNLLVNQHPVHRS
jgi:uncharacterized SAM-binding protein YcdF (DUF218 family)